MKKSMSIVLVMALLCTSLTQVINSSSIDIEDKVKFVNPLDAFTLFAFMNFIGRIK